MSRASAAPPMLLIHGLIGAFDVDAGLPRHAAPPLLGYGEHQATPPARISLPAQVEHLRAFIDTHFDGVAVDLVGHSVGGAVAMLLAQAYPQRVRRIVNVEGNFTLADAFWSASVARMSAGEAVAMLDGFRADPLGWLGGGVAEPRPHWRDTAARWLAWQPASTLRAMAASVVAGTGAAGYQDTLRQVFARHPVYLLSGARSHAGWNVPDWAWRACAGRQALDGCGHLMMLERPEAFVAALRHCLGHDGN
ncbi:alpha/beta fold hydrolase [Achromobacter insuavis]|uniref:alpha/beta fold hydrolase n=1 Tax=Achromobacter insuavis TaxID=1287735 RepID=UPI00359F9712